MSFVSSKLIRHIPIVHGRAVGVAGLRVGILCKMDNWSEMHSSNAAPCDKCDLILAVLKANSPAAWCEQLPFRHREYLTLAARLYALEFLEPVQQDFTGEPPHPTVTRWKLAGTFNYLREHISSDPGVMPHRKSPNGWSFCHFCGSKPRHSNHVQRDSCAVCGSGEITRDSRIR